MEQYDKVIFSAKADIKKASAAKCINKLDGQQFFSSCR